MLEPAGRRRRRQGSQRGSPHAAEAGWFAVGRAEGAQPQHQSILPGCGRKRAAGDPHLRALQLPASGEIRGVEGYRDQFQSAVHVPQLSRLSPERKRIEQPMLKRDSTLSHLALNRRTLLAATAAGAAWLAHPLRRAAAAVRLDVTQGNIQPLPIAIPDFLGGTPADGEAARGVSQVITANL